MQVELWTTMSECTVVTREVPADGPFGGEGEAFAAEIYMPGDDPDDKTARPWHIAYGYSIDDVYVMARALAAQALEEHNAQVAADLDEIERLGNNAEVMAA